MKVIDDSEVKGQFGSLGQKSRSFSVTGNSNGDANNAGMKKAKHPYQTAAWE